MRSLVYDNCKTDTTAVYDFKRVTTYLPIMGLFFRGFALISIMHWWMYTFKLPLNAVIMLSARYVYMDVLPLITDQSFVG